MSHKGKEQEAMEDGNFEALIQIRNQGSLLSESNCYNEKWRGRKNQPCKEWKRENSKRGSVLGGSEAGGSVEHLQKWRIVRKLVKQAPSGPAPLRCAGSTKESGLSSKHIQKSLRILGSVGRRVVVMDQIYILKISLRSKELKFL